MLDLAQKLQQFPELHRRKFLETAIALAVDTGRIFRAMEFINNPDYITARIAEPDWGPRKFIEDLLRSYPKIREADERVARELLERFLTYVFGHRRALDIDDVFIWLQALGRDHLLPDSLDLVLTEQWLPSSDDKVEIQRFKLKCRRSRASLLRRELKYPEADSELALLYAEWQKSEHQDTKELAILGYEIGYSAYLQGRTKDATTAFFEGARLAASTADRVGELIDSFFAYVSLYHGHEICALDAKGHFEEHRRALLAEGPTQMRVDAWLYNIDYALFDVACQLCDVEESQRLADQVQSDRFLRDSRDVVMQRLMGRIVQGRAAVVRKENEVALHHFASFLDVELNQWGTREPDLEKLAHSRRDGIAVCYRDAGISLCRIEEHEIAHCVWNRGLACRPDAGNTYYQMDISRLLVAAV